MALPKSVELPPRWRALIAGFLGWMLDGYDYTILTLVIIDIQRDLHASSAAMGALGSITLLTRLAGGVWAGHAADRYGRKAPLIISIVWFSVFAALSGFATSYAMLFALRALFGLGMGGEWAAGTPLVLEHWPERQRGVVSGALQGAFSWGFILAALVFHFVYPLLDASSGAWRVMLWTGVLPALLVLWIRRSVPESPEWLARSPKGTQSHEASASARALLHSVWRPLLILGALLFSYQSMTFWYATLLRHHDVWPLPFLVALNVGGIIGAASWGAVADTRVGRHGAMAIAVAIAIALTPGYLFASAPATLFAAALAMGLTGAGVIGLAPAYLASSFPTAFRGRGAGLTYHLAAAVGALAPLAIGVLEDRAWQLSTAMALAMLAAGAIALLGVAVDAAATRASR